MLFCLHLWTTLESNSHRKRKTSSELICQGRTNHEGLCSPNLPVFWESIERDGETERRKLSCTCSLVLSHVPFAPPISSDCSPPAPPSSVSMLTQTPLAEAYRCSRQESNAVPVDTSSSSSSGTTSQHVIAVLAWEKHTMYVLYFVGRPIDNRKEPRERRDSSPQRGETSMTAITFPNRNTCAADLEKTR